MNPRRAAVLLPVLLLASALAAQPVAAPSGPQQAALPARGPFASMFWTWQDREIENPEVLLAEFVEAGRASMRAGLGRSNDEVEAAFAARRNQVAAGHA